MRASRDEVRAEQLTAYRQVSGCKGKHILGITQRPIVHILIKSYLNNIKFTVMMTPLKMLLSVVFATTALAGFAQLKTEKQRGQMKFDYAFV